MQRLLLSGTCTQNININMTSPNSFLAYKDPDREFMLKNMRVINNKLDNLDKFFVDMVLSYNP